MTTAPSVQEATPARERRVIEVSLFVLGSAAFYAVTMILMKYWGIMPPIVMALLIGLAFALGAWCEIEALKIERLSAIYVAILSIECLFISLASFAVFGEQVTAREVTGGLIIVTGIVIAAT